MRGSKVIIFICLVIFTFYYFYRNFFFYLELFFSRDQLAIKHNSSLKNYDVPSGISTLSLMSQYSSPSKASEPKVLSLVIFKLPRSGSSWFTDLLNSYPTIYLSKEIVQHSDRNVHSIQEVEDHLMKALRHPADKLGARARWWPTSRFFADSIQHMKSIRTLDVVGFTVNPEHCVVRRELDPCLQRGPPCTASRSVARAAQPGEGGRLRLSWSRDSYNLWCVESSARRHCCKIRTMQQIPRDEGEDESHA